MKNNTVEMLSTPKADVLTKYRSADEPTKAIFRDLYGQNLMPRPIQERIGSFEDICREAGENPADFIITPDMSSRIAGRISSAKIQLIFEICNEGWIANFADENQRKYYIIFDYKPGSGFACNVYFFTGTDTNVGARLSTYSAEMAKFIGTTFIKEFNEYHIINQEFQSIDKPL